jgi:hypothetical protein
MKRKMVFSPLAISIGLAFFVTVVNGSGMFSQISKATMRPQPLAQKQHLYGDPWADVPVRSVTPSTLPFRWQWISDGPGIYSTCIVRAWSTDGREHGVDVQDVYKDADGQSQSGGTEEWNISPKYAESVLSAIGRGDGGCSQVVELRVTRLLD